MTALKFKKLHEKAKSPVYSTAEASGMDVCSIEHRVIQPGEFQKILCGFSVEIEPGFELQVRPRSGLAAKYGVTILNTPGTIDSDYRGEVAVILINHGKNPFEVMRGDRIAQLVLARTIRAEISEVDNLSESIRGSNGFGSTGIS